MRIKIQGVGFALSAGLLDHTARRLRFAVTRTSDRIKRVMVRLGNVRGSHGSENKFCRIQVVFDCAPPVLIEDAGTDLYAAISRATERAGRSVANSEDRLRENVRLERAEPSG